MLAHIVYNTLSKFGDSASNSTLLKTVIFDIWYFDLERELLSQYEVHLSPNFYSRYITMYTILYPSVMIQLQPKPCFNEL